MTQEPTDKPYENRTSRDKFTKALQRICARLDNQNSFEIEDRSELVRRLVSSGRIKPEDLRERVEITTLWVVGSYARGALTCGDLDVVIATRCADGQKHRVPYGRLLKPAFGHVPHLRVYEGTPGENSSGVSFSDAVCLWTPGAHWRAAIDAIKPEPAARRFTRDADIVPLRAEQLYGDVETVKSLVEHFHTGEISWRFLPCAVTPELNDISDIEQRLLERGGWGRKTRELIPSLLQYLRLNLLTDFAAVSSREGATLDIHGVHVAMGRPYPDHCRLTSIKCSRVLAIPHTSRRGPNGIWELRRGANHPLEKLFVDVFAYAHQLPDGKLSIIRECGEYWNDYAFTLQLFSNEERAQAEIEWWVRHSEEPIAPEHQRSVVRLNGSALLDAIALADTLEIEASGDSSTFCHLTRTGARIAGTEGEIPFKEPDPGIVIAALR